MTDDTTSPRSKAELLDRMRTGREAWDALIARISAGELTQPALPNGWSVKDLIAHVAAYENWTAAQVRAASENRPPTDMELYGVEELPPDPEGWDLDRQNAAIYAQYQDMPLEDVTAFSERAFADLIGAIDGVAEADLAAPDAQSWTNGTSLLAIIPGQCYGHYEQHVDDVRSLAGQDVS